MKYEKNKTKRIDIRINETLKNKYLKFIKNNGYSLTKRIIILIENDMKNGK